MADKSAPPTNSADASGKAIDVVEVPDDDQTERPPQKKKRKAPASKEGVDNTGVPGKCIFPAELPANLVKQLREYFIAKNSNIVPQDIYFMQVPWIFKLHNGRTKKDASDAGYFLASTGQQVNVRAFPLPHMNAQPGGMNAQRMLVADDRAVAKHPVILIRVKPHSPEFRIWGGLNDDVWEQGVVVKKPLNATNQEQGAENTASASGAAGPSAVDDGDDSNDTPATTIRKRRGRVSELAEVAGASDDDFSYLSGGSGYDKPSKKRKRVVEDDEEGSQYQPEEAYATEYSAYLPPRRSASTTSTNVRAAAPRSPAVPSPTTDRKQNVIIYFSGEESRMRTLAACDSFTKFFTQAVAAGIIASDARFPVLKCVLSGATGGARARVIADEQDFDDMVRAVVSDAAWLQEGVSCEVQVSKV